MAELTGIAFNGTDNYAVIPVSLENCAEWSAEFLISSTEDKGNSRIYRQPCILGLDSSGAVSGDFHVDIKYGRLHLFSGLGGKNTEEQLNYGTLSVDNNDYAWDTNIRINDGSLYKIKIVLSDFKLSLFLDANYLGYLNTSINVLSSNLYIGASYPSEKVFCQFNLFDFSLYVDGEMQARYLPSVEHSSFLKDYSENEHNAIINGNYCSVVKGYYTPKKISFLYADIERITNSVFAINADTYVYELNKNQLVGMTFNGKNNYAIIPVSLQSADIWSVEMVLSAAETSAGQKIYNQPCIFGVDTGGYCSGDFHIDLKAGRLHLFSGMAGKNDVSQLSCGSISVDNGDYGWDTGININDGKMYKIRLVMSDTILSLFLDDKYLGYINTARSIAPDKLYLGSSYPGEKVFCQFNLFDFSLCVDEEMRARYLPSAEQFSCLTDFSGNENHAVINGDKCSIIIGSYNPLNYFSVCADTGSMTCCSFAVDADMQLIEVASDSVSADSLATVLAGQRISVDTCAFVKHCITNAPFKILADVHLGYKADENIFSDSIRKLMCYPSLCYDTMLMIRGKSWSPVGVVPGMTDIGNGRWIFYSPADVEYFSNTISKDNYVMSDNLAYSYSGRAVSADFLTWSFPVYDGEVWIAADIYAPDTSKYNNYSFSMGYRTWDAENWGDFITAPSWSYGSAKLYLSDNIGSLATYDGWKAKFDKAPMNRPYRLLIHWKFGRLCLFEAFADGVKLGQYTNQEWLNGECTGITFGMKALSGDIGVCYMSEMYATNDEKMAALIGYPASSHSFSENCDTGRHIIAHKGVLGDTVRSVAGANGIPFWMNADTSRTRVVALAFNADSLMKIIAPYKINADMLRKLADIADRENFFIDFDTARGMSRIVSFTSDTIRRLPFDTTFSIPANIEKPPAPFLVPAEAQLGGMVSMDIMLNELSLSDTFEMETTHDVGMLDAVRGRIIDFDYSYLISEMRWRDRVISASGMYDEDSILFTPMTYAEGSAKHKASYHAEKIALALGRKLNIAIRDFTHSSTWIGGGQTYDSIISSLFGWTSSIPHRQINVFFRAADNSINIIQRGHEIKTIDITDTSHTRPEYMREIVRTMWTVAGKNGIAISNAQNINIEPMPFWGTLTFGDAVCSYESGYLIKEIVNGETTDYEYVGYPETGKYLHRKTTKHSDDSTTVTCYDYNLTASGVKILGMEEEITTDKNGNETVRKTIHAPLGSGFYGTSVYIDGVYQGSSISTGTPSGVASRYLRNDESITFSGAVYRGGADKDNGSTGFIESVSFPVEEDSILEELANEIKWLNRKIKETVTLDIYNYNHVVDFTERIKFRGQEYYLVSNIIKQTVRELKQTVTMARWY